MTQPVSRPWFGRQPAFIIQGIGAVLALLIAFRLPGLNDHVAAAITALLVAVAAALTAVHVRPVAPTVFNGVVTALAALVSSYWGHLDQMQVGSVTLTLAALMTAWSWSQQTPVVS